MGQHAETNQGAFNIALKIAMRKYNLSTVILPRSLFPNGARLDENNATAKWVHANYRVGKQEKLKFLIEHGLNWSELQEAVKSLRCQFTRNEDLKMLSPSRNVAKNPMPIDCGLFNDTQKFKTVQLVSPGHGSMGRISKGSVMTSLQNKNLHDVFHHLLDYTGLSENEIYNRLMRISQFHFDGEFNWWSPNSESELKWYYRHSVSYLFGNSIHPDITEDINLSAEDGPVLDYSGGVGNNVIGLAKRMIPSFYFGIGIMEKDFARFRVNKLNVSDYVTFVDPFYTNSGSPDGLSFHPYLSLAGVQPKTIILSDVLEHIPEYHVTLRFLINILQPGGKIYERSPFDDQSSGISIHLKASMPIQQAMQGMQYVGQKSGHNIWIKRQPDNKLSFR
jgi:hypothetical protein